MIARVHRNMAERCDEFREGAEKRKAKKKASTEVSDTMVRSTGGLAGARQPCFGGSATSMGGRTRQGSSTSGRNPANGDGEARDGLWR